MAQIIHNPCMFMQKYMTGELKQLYELTQESGREHGFFIYEDRGKIEHTPIQSGSVNNITLRMKSVFGLGILNSGIPIATVHSHPNKEFNYLFSDTDIKTMLSSGLEFAVVVFKSSNGPRCSVYSSSKYGNFKDLKRHTVDSYFAGIPDVSEIDLVEALNNELKLCEFKV